MHWPPQDVHKSPQGSVLARDWKGTHQDRMGREPGKPNKRARWVAKEYKTHARPELCASTPPLEALKVVLSKIVTGKREGKVVALVDVRRAYFYVPARGTAARGLPGRRRAHVRAAAI